jgi:hypothetical protein
MPGEIPWPADILDRMVIAVEKVRDRLDRATSALASAGVPYALVGGNAVAAWVARVDPAAVRNTQGVDLLLRRSDLDAATVPLAAIGFVRRHAKGVDMFLDGPDARARDAVHIVFAGEKVRPDSMEPAPDVDESETIGTVRVVRVDLRDMIDVGLIDAGWVARLPTVLGTRLQELLDTPEG